MPLVSMKKMLTDAREKKIAIGAFLPWNYLSAKAIANASKRLGQPVIYICPWQPPTHIGGFRSKKSRTYPLRMIVLYFPGVRRRNPFQRPLTILFLDLIET